MFISVKRHQKEQQELLGASSRLTDAILKYSSQGLFLLDAKDRILLPVSQSMTVLFRRLDFNNLSIEKLLAPVVSAKTLSVTRAYMASLLSGAPRDPAEPTPLADIEVRLTNPDGSFDTAHYSFEFDLLVPSEPRAWLVRVTDLTASMQSARELDDLRAQFQIQGDILRGVMHMGGARLEAFVQKADASMKTIATVLKKPAREEDAFRHKLDEIVDEVDRIRRDAAAFKLASLETAARMFEDALHELRNRSALSGGDFLPLAVKLDQLYNVFALVKSLSAAAGPPREPEAGSHAPAAAAVAAAAVAVAAEATVAAGATSVAAMATSSAPPTGATAGSLEGTLRALTEHVAHQHHKQVVLLTSGLNDVPPVYQATVKNVAIQLIRNAVMHGIEPVAARSALGKVPRGTLRIEFRTRGKSHELLFEDDGCGLIPDQVRATAVSRGIVTPESAARMRDREAIKLIFKSRFTTLAASPTDTTHGAGMSLVRRYVHAAGGKIALASLAGFETRFKITLPLTPAADTRGAAASVAPDAGTPEAAARVPEPQVA